MQGHAFETEFEPADLIDYGLTDDPDIAVLAHRLLEGSVPIETLGDRTKRTQAWLRACHGRPSPRQFFSTCRSAARARMLTSCPSAACCRANRRICRDMP